MSIFTTSNEDNAFPRSNSAAPISATTAIAPIAANFPRRVVITGMGAICGLGKNLPTIWKNATLGKSGISLLEKIDTSTLPVKIGGEVKNFTIANELLEEKEHRRFDTFVHFALHSAHEALLDSGLLSAVNNGQGRGHLNDGNYLADRIGCILGVGMGGFPLVEQTCGSFFEGGYRKVSPFFIPSIIPNITSGMISIKYGLKGVNYSLSSACASSAHALLACANEIRLGNCDCMVAGGAEAVLSYMPISGFANMKALSRSNEQPSKVSRPFDLNRDGFVMGEGAAILVLEEMEAAKRRGARIYAEFLGGAASSDAYHITAPHPEGEGAALCMQKALENARISADTIDYINAHGTATHLGDIAETKAIKKVFTKRCNDIAISATKSMTGHLLGAAGAIESVFCVKALETGIIPPTINLEKPDPECDLFYVPNESISRPIHYALSNSFGFGGTNASLVFKREE
ncbi:MAG: beta-ketoacyl-ACP synthase II [Oligoflexia bacterium]|nr:beta-ketoacyl-ACP synthase II [Oligoflexia bacterium]